MKLATLKTDTKDGKLLVVSRDLRRATHARSPFITLQLALENWSVAEPILRKQYDRLNLCADGGAFSLSLASLTAPLPRAPQWLDGSAFHSHGDLMEKVLGLDPPPDKLTIPLMYQGASDDFLGPYEDMRLPSEEDGIDFEAEIGVIVDRVAMGTTPEVAAKRIRLITLLNDASLRNFAGREIRTGFGFLQAKPATSFAPIVITPDELGPHWKDQRVHLPVVVSWNGRSFGRPNAGQMGFGFDELISHASRTRNLSAGTIIGSGTISNSDFRICGSACIAERRGIETLDNGKATTGYMHFNDWVRIDVTDPFGVSVFGPIEQRVVASG
jgi:fumarylacetoacetate (FAA) hydrolase